MEREPCKFDSPRWCDYSAQSPDGERVRVATIAGELRSVLNTFTTDEKIREQIVEVGQCNPYCVAISLSLMAGFCSACRKVVAASGATDIRLI